MLFNVLNLQSWLSKKHMTRQREKPKHCQDHIGIISPLNNSEHNTILHTCPTVHGVDTVFGRVRAKHKERQSMRNTDRQPVVQIYGCFVPAGENVQRRTILAGTYMFKLVAFVAVPARGRYAYRRMALMSCKRLPTKQVGPSAYFNTRKSYH